MNRHEFSSALRSLQSMEGGDLIVALPSATPGDVRRFEGDPAQFFLRCSDERSAALWRFMAGRSHAGFDDAPRAHAETPERRARVDALAALPTAAE